MTPSRKPVLSQHVRILSRDARCALWATTSGSRFQLEAGTCSLHLPCKDEKLFASSLPGRQRACPWHPPAEPSNSYIAELGSQTLPHHLRTLFWTSGETTACVHLLRILKLGFEPKSSILGIEHQGQPLHSQTTIEAGPPRPSLWRSTL